MYPRLHSFNDNYFTILKPGSAYTMGYIYGDGCVSTSHGRWCTLVIFGALEDKALLESMVKDMGSDKKVTYNERGRVSCVYITSPQMVEDLAKWGLGPRSSKRMKFPQIPQFLMKHFLRGYLDADGCIQREKSGKLRVSFVCSDVAFLTSVRDYIYGVIGLTSKVSVHKTSGAGFLRYGCSSGDKVLEWMKPDGGLFLKRKWDKLHLA